jgi:hypothetical protein
MQYGQLGLGLGAVGPALAPCHIAVKIFNHAAESPHLPFARLFETCCLEYKVRQTELDVAQTIICATALSITLSSCDVAAKSPNDTDCWHAHPLSHAVVVSGTRAGDGGSSVFWFMVSRDHENSTYKTNEQTNPAELVGHGVAQGDNRVILLLLLLLPRKKVYEKISEPHTQVNIQLEACQFVEAQQERHWYWPFWQARPAGQT